MVRKMFSFDELSNDVQPVLDVLAGQSELACALIGGAYLEKFLGVALRNFFIDDKKVLKFFGSGGVLENSGAQNDLAFALGFTSPLTYRNIDLIQRIRNAFAHAHKPASFKDNSISNLCTELEFPSKSNQKIKWPKNDPKSKYVMIVALTTGILSFTAQRIKRQQLDRVATLEGDLMDALKRIADTQSEQNDGPVK